MFGDPAVWLNRFRSLDSRFLQRLIAVWPTCVARLPGQPNEDQITLNLVDILSKDHKVRRLFYWIEFQFEPFGYTSGGLAYSKGKIDMALLLDKERERYLAYECKRLNVAYNGKKSSLARPYVMDGLSRFVTEQYAENLTVGCMLGYVLDGNVPVAQSKIHAAIFKNKSHIGLTEGPKPEYPIGNILRFTSRHFRPSNAQEIEIRHALVPFPKKAALKKCIPSKDVKPN